MSDQHLPHEHQPDAVPQSVPAPSLWLYVCMLLVAAGLIVIGFWDGADWRGLWINLAASLISAVVFFVLVDRRLRQSEMSRLRTLPRNFQMTASLALSPRRRQLYRYGTAYLAALEVPLKTAVHIAGLNQLQEKIHPGFILVGGGGSGKTTLLQLLAEQQLRSFLATLKGRVPVFLNLNDWLPDRTLKEALIDNANTFSRFSRGPFERSLKRGELLVILDSYDEMMFMRDERDLQSELSQLKAGYPNTSWIVASSPKIPLRIEGLPDVKLAQPTDEELAAIRRRHGIG